MAIHSNYQLVSNSINTENLTPNITREVSSGAPVRKSDFYLNDMTYFLP